jgi:hypothetical protein
MNGDTPRHLHDTPIAGFAAGCGLGAVCEAAFGLQFPELPVGFALLALAPGLSGEVNGRVCR